MDADAGNACAKADECRTCDMYQPNEGNRCHAGTPTTFFPIMEPVLVDVFDMWPGKASEAMNLSYSDAPSNLHAASCSKEQTLALDLHAFGSSWAMWHAGNGRSAKEGDVHARCG